jgi:vitamin B12 transporter
MASYRYANLARTRAQGAEIDVTVSPVDGLDLALAYSLVDTRDRSPGSARYDAHLPRRPVHAVSLSVDRRWPFGLATGATLRLAGDALDPTAPTGELDGHVRLDLRAALPVGDALELFGRVENAFDADYETAYGYATYGRSAYAGIRLRL